jgi:WD40 repeat protein
MKKTHFFPIALIALIVIVSCNPVRRTTNTLIGDWQIVSFEEQAGGKQEVVASNVGTITLNEDKTGKRLFSYSIMGHSAKDTTDFSWMNTENSILLDSGQDSDSKLWIISSMKKNTQTWITTDGQANMQIMTLERIKE